MPPLPPTELIEVQSSLSVMQPVNSVFLQLLLKERRVDQSVRLREPRSNSPC